MFTLIVRYLEILYYCSVSFLARDLDNKENKIISVGYSNCTVVIFNTVTVKTQYKAIYTFVVVQ